MQTEQTDIILIIVVITIVLLLLVSFIVTFLFVYQRRIYRHKQEKQEMEEQFRQEMLKAQIELQEQVLGDISAEIHDNLGQMLSVIKLNLTRLNRKENTNEEESALVEELRSQVSGVISDMRNISKTLSPGFISDFGLAETLKIELDKVARTGIMETRLITNREPEKFNPKIEIVLFRITQELINNAIKHSEASLLEVRLEYNHETLKMFIEDNGKGFDSDEITTRLADQSGNGLKNMRNRVKIIGGVLTLESSPDKGTRVEITINTQNSLLMNQINI